MIFGIDWIQAASGLVLAGLTTCGEPPAPAIETIFLNSKPVEKYVRSMAALTENVRENGAVGHENGLAEFTKIGGLTKSSLIIGTEIKFSYLRHPAAKTSCFWIEKVKIIFDYKPTIYVATDFQKGSCMYIRIMAHEQRHVDVDILTVEEYMPYFKTIAGNIVSNIGAIGPVPDAEMDEAKKYLETLLTRPLDKAGEKMEYARLYRQQSVDNLDIHKLITPDCTGAKFQ